LFFTPSLSSSIFTLTVSYLRLRYDYSPRDVYVLIPERCSLFRYRFDAYASHVKRQNRRRINDMMLMLVVATPDTPLCRYHVARGSGAAITVPHDDAPRGSARVRSVCCASRCCERKSALFAITFARWCLRATIG